MATRWMWRPSWIPGPYRWTTPSSRWPGLTTVTSGSLRSASLATPRPRTHSSTPHSLGQCPSVCGIKILFNYILTLKISKCPFELLMCKIQDFIEPILVPNGATKIYNHKKEDDPKDRTHVYKMMFTYKCYTYTCIDTFINRHIDNIANLFSNW